MKLDALRRYLADHLAGATYTVELIDRCRKLYPDPELAGFFEGILQDVEADRAVLHAMIRRIGGSESRVKNAGARMVERLTRLQHVDPSQPAESGLLERLELLASGIEGKSSLWQALDACSGGTGRFGGVELDRLRERAREQHARVAAQHGAAARRAFLPGDGDWGGTSRMGDSGPLKGVLLDVDGTLMATNDAHARAWVDAFADVGLDFPLILIQPLIGMSGERLVTELTGIPADTDESRFIRDCQSRHFLERYLPGCEPFDGVRALLERFRDDGLGRTVVTSSSEEQMKRVLEKAGVADLVERTTTASGSSRSKPDPDIVRSALQISGWEASESLLLGDTPYDVQAGRAAEAGVVAFRCGGSGDAELAGAMAIYDDPAELLASYDASPFRRRPVTRSG